MKFTCAGDRKSPSQKRSDTKAKYQTICKHEQYKEGAHRNNSRGASLVDFFKKPRASTTGTETPKPSTSEKPLHDVREYQKEFARRRRLHNIKKDLGP